MLSAWMIVVFLALAWGPLFIAEYVRVTRPDLSASYQPQSFAMQWMRVTVLCSVLAIIYSVIGIVRLVSRWTQH